MVSRDMRHRTLLEQSSGLNFGTISLGADWKTWPVEMSVRAFPSQALEAILIFDALVQYTDRASDNPNLMWRGHEIAVLDHEKCFGYLGLAPDQKRPWREFFARRAMQTHCLLPAGKNLIRNDFGKEMWENLLGLEFSSRVPQLVAIANGAFPEAGLELGRISAYFDLLLRDIEDFLGHLMHTLDR
jgi:hypothetical protein